jgi:hypothetical protein
MADYQYRLVERQVALVDRAAGLSEEDINALQSTGIKIIQVAGDPAKVFLPVSVFQKENE